MTNKILLIVLLSDSDNLLINLYSIYYITDWIFNSQQIWIKNENELGGAVIVILDLIKFIIMNYTGSLGYVIPFFSEANFI